jgi:hypothetical protein
MNIPQLVARELSLGITQVQNALALFAEGGTIPSIARASGAHLPDDEAGCPFAEETDREKKSPSIQDLMAKFNKP